MGCSPASGCFAVRGPAAVKGAAPLGVTLTLPSMLTILVVSLTDVRFTYLLGGSHSSSNLRAGDQADRFLAWVRSSCRKTPVLLLPGGMRQWQ